MINSVDTRIFLKEFQEATPFSYLIIDDFLNADALKDLAQALAKEEFSFKMSDLFNMYQTVDLSSSSNFTIKKFYDFFKSSEFIGFCHKVTGINFTPNALDLQGSIYRDTNFLLCHDDQLEGRKLAFILYMSDLSQEDGGALTLFTHKDCVPTQVTQKIYPRVNRFVCFEVSDVSFHEVEEVLVDKQRLSLGGWLH